MGRYQLELTEDDRANLLIALGSFAGLCMRDQGKIPEAWHELTKKIASLLPADGSRIPDAHGAGAPQTAPAAGSNVSSPAAGSLPGGTRPPESRAGGNQPLDSAESRPADSDVTELRITPYSITQMGTGEKLRLVVEWREILAGNRTQTKKASCWVSQKEIWPRVLEKVKRPAVFVVKENRGYLNIVGVR